MVDKYHFIITNLDANTIDLEDCQYGGANITILRMVDTSNDHVAEYAKYVTNKAKEEKQGATTEGAQPEDNGENDERPNEEDAEGGEGDENKDGNAEASEPTPSEEKAEEEEEGFNANTVRLQTALIYDGVFLLVETFKQLGLEQIKPEELACNGNETMREKGLSITNFMRNTMIDGMTKSVKFDENGHRSEFELQIFQLNSQGPIMMATWSAEDGIKHTGASSAEPSGDSAVLSLRNQTFIVLTALTPPYGIRDSSMQLTGNDRFEGYGIDIIFELSELLGFKYEFRLQEDKDYGSINKVTKEWTGMIRALRDDDAHLAITDLTITSQRESGADFTMPFMNLGISLLYLKPTKEPPSTFSFMAPFSMSVWISVFLAYFIVSLCFLYWED